MAKRKSVGLEPFEAADKEAELFKQRPFDGEGTVPENPYLNISLEVAEMEDPGPGPDGQPAGKEYPFLKPWNEIRDIDETEQAALPHIETHTETQSLKCILTHDEIKLAGERMARADGEKRDHEATLKSVSSRYKSLIDEAIAVIGSEAERIRSGYEFRAVEIVVEMDHSRGRVTKTRRDTAEILEDRKMNDFELQRKIRF